MTNDVPGPRRIGKPRKVTPASGAPHRGPVGFAVFVASTHGGQIVLDPPAAGAPKVTIDEDGTRALREALIE
ncbi:MAG: hypothetical protein JO272_16745 [Pseudonocardiales bacterium]|nr:hypothetical protein [Pseudonocardiales bacterium]